LLLIHIERAKERILYEKYLRSLDDCTPLPQENLFPTTIEMDAISYSLLDEAQALFHKIGFDISFLPPSTISVNGLPGGYSTDIPSIKRGSMSLWSSFRSTGRTPFPEQTGDMKWPCHWPNQGQKGQQ
jgi:hypothetical protein